MFRPAYLGRLIARLAGVTLTLVTVPDPAAGLPDLPIQDGPQIELRIDSDGTVVVEGLGDAAALSRAATFSRDDWRRVLQVVARDPERTAVGTELPPLLGSYELDGSVLRFAPRFPPAPGLVLEARFDMRRWQDGADRTAPNVLTTSFVMPQPDADRTTRVTAVYPATETVPANLLRFYVHFTAPMSARHVLPHLALLDRSGQTVDTAFVDVEGGLWDPSRTRLTLFVHPGRVKRGVGPNQAMGPVLEEGQSYTLRIGEQATDAFGRRLVRSYEHSFRVGPEDHVSPDPDRWTLTSPAAPAEPLRVELIEAADVALLVRMPEVFDAGGGFIPGRIDVATDGSSFTYTPSKHWMAGNYELRVPAALEDPSGNRVTRRFEATEGSLEATTSVEETIHRVLPFRIE